MVEKKILFSLMGSTSGPVFNATQLLAWTDLCIFYSEDFLSEVENAKNKLKEMYPSSEITYYSIPPFNLREGMMTIIQRMTEIIAKYKDFGYTPHVSINITGGTDIMTSAILLAGIMLKSKLYYIKTKKDEETGEYKDPELVDILPPQLVPDELDETKWKIITKIHEGRNTKERLTTAKIAELAGFNSSAALKRHLDYLEKNGIVSSEKQGKYRYVSLTDNGEMFYMIKKLV